MAGDGQALGTLLAVVSSVWGGSPSKGDLVHLCLPRRVLGAGRLWEARAPSSPSLFLPN